MTMTPNSFNFGKYNSFDDWGIRCIKYDVLMPQKRQLLLTVPKRSGSIRQDGKYYDDRRIRIECDLRKKIPYRQVRYIAYWLSNRNKLTFWDDPGLSYIAEAYNETDIVTWMSESGREFEIELLAEPFAFGDYITMPIYRGYNPIKYNGTFETPTTVTITNTGTIPINSIQLTVINEQERY